MPRIRVTLEAELDSPQYPGETPEDLPFLRENLGQLLWDSAKYNLFLNVEMCASDSKRRQELEAQGASPEELAQHDLLHQHGMWSRSDDAQVMEKLLEGFQVEILEYGPARPTDYSEYQ